MIRILVRATLLFLLVAIPVVCITGYLIVARFVGDIPQISSISDYKPSSVSSVYGADGTLIGEFFVERRYPVKIKDVPLLVKQAVLAAEDLSFYSHPGINPVSIIRAALKNLESGHVAQGGSTITQQVVKNLFLSPEKTVERKLKEAILAYQLENSLSKDEIFEIYLNQIYFGNGSYGIKAAAQEYFHKGLDDLNLAEAATLAGLPKAPSMYSPIINSTASLKRRRYVLRRMNEAGFISSEEAEKASNSDVLAFASRVEKRFIEAPYYLREFRDHFKKYFPQYDLDRDGLRIYTTLDINADRFVSNSLRKGLRAVDKRIGWRGPKASGVSQEKFLKEFASNNNAPVEQQYAEPTLALVQGVDLAKSQLDVSLGGDIIGTVDLSDSEWSNHQVLNGGVNIFKSTIKSIRPGDVIEVSGSLNNLKLDQTPEIEGAAVLLSAQNGALLAMQGGYQYVEGGFNRVTQGKRQPGSSFKPFVYLTALREFGYTPASVLYDIPRSFKVGSEYWEPKNYDGKYLGPVTLQRGLELSRNIIVADLISRIGVDSVVKVARSMGIESELGHNLSLALGTSEVSLFELVRAYSVFASGGILYPISIVNKIESDSGKLLYSPNLVKDKESSKLDNNKLEQPRLERAKRVIDEKIAFVLTSMLTGVVQRGTATRLKVLDRAIAGKTGTTNDQMDAWFVGFTPRYVCGVWVGFDQRRNIGAKETGGRIAVPIWLEIMKSFLSYKESTEKKQLIEFAQDEAQVYGVKLIEPEKELKAPTFPVPAGVTPYFVNKYSGVETSKEDPDGITMYFIEGSRPGVAEKFDDHQVEEYLYGM